jgi:phosphatidylserine decarboxylase
MVNEKRIYLIKGKIRVKVVQVAGIMARRTVSWVKEGQELAQGDKIGLIKLGSCTQVTFPSGYKVSVTEGDKVQGGLTIIGEES